VRGAERVVDIGVVTLDQPFDERRIHFLLAGVQKRKVLCHLDARGELGEPLADGATSKRASRAPLGRPRWV